MAYFPIKIQITEGAEKGQVKICLSPEDTPNGIAFRVTETNVVVAKVE